MLRQSLCALALLVGLSVQASADSFTVYGTGTDAVGNAVVGNSAGIADLHYTIASGPAGAGTTMFLTVVDGFPIGPWFANDSKSRWISPSNTDNDVSSNTVPFVVQTTFTLAGLDPTTAVIKGKWAADNGASFGTPTNFSEIRLNGNATGNVANAVGYYNPLHDFSISTGFVAGVNTLQFIVYNALQATGNPMGLRVQIDSATASPAQAIPDVPEPASLALLGFGLVGVARRLRSRD